MSIVKDFATLAMPSLTCSMMDGDELGAVEVVFVAGSPANLRGNQPSISRVAEKDNTILIRHDYKETLRGKLVCLQLVVGAVDSCASSKKE